jgi:hypothetical protein
MSAILCSLMLQIAYGVPSDAQPLCNAHKNQIINFQNMYDHCSCQTARFDHNILDLTSTHSDSYCILISHNHDWLSPVLPLHHCTHAPACHQTLWSHWSMLMIRG